jgi:chromosome segregation ATPase
LDIYSELENSLRADLGHKQEDCEALRKYIDELKDEGERLKGGNKSLGLEVADYLKALEKSREDGRRLAEGGMELEKMCGDLRIENSNLDLGVKTGLAELKSVSQEMDDVKEINKRLNGLVEELNEIIGKMGEELKGKDHKIQTLSKDLQSTIENELNPTRVKLLDRETDLVRCKDEISELRAVNQELSTGYEENKMT